MPKVSTQLTPPLGGIARLMPLTTSTVESTGMDTCADASNFIPMEENGRMVVSVRPGVASVCDLVRAVATPVNLNRIGALAAHEAISLSDPSLRQSYVFAVFGTTTYAGTTLANLAIAGGTPNHPAQATIAPRHTIICNHNKAVLIGNKPASSNIRPYVATLSVPAPVSAPYVNFAELGASTNAPINCSIGCFWRDRLVLSDTTIIYMSRVGSFETAADWNTAPPSTEESAISLNTSGSLATGGTADRVTALIPWTADRLVVGCLNSIHVLNGDPRQGGVLVQVSGEGIIGPRAWCIDASGVLWFVGRRHLFRWVPGELPRNVTANLLPSLVARADDAQAGHRGMSLAWDSMNQGVWIGATDAELSVSEIVPRSLVGAPSVASRLAFFSAQTMGLFPQSIRTSGGFESPVHAMLALPPGLVPGAASSDVVLTGPAFSVSSHDFRAPILSLRADLHLDAALVPNDLAPGGYIRYRPVAPFPHPEEAICTGIDVFFPASTSGKVQGSGTLYLIARDDEEAVASVVPPTGTNMARVVQRTNHLRLMCRVRGRCFGIYWLSSHTGATVAPRITMHFERAGRIR